MIKVFTRGCSMEKISISFFNNKDLYFAVAIKDGKIIKSILPKANNDEALDEITAEFKDYKISKDYRSLAKSVSDIYYGKKSIFKKEMLHLNLSEFQKRVLLEVMKIPYGKIKTYKQVSEAIDSKAYRAVGTAIAKNPFPLIIPCHRVVRTDLDIGGFYEGPFMKKEILQNEGIKIKGFKIINLKFA